MTFTTPLIALWNVLIHGLFDARFWKNDFAMILWLVLTAIVVLRGIGSELDWGKFNS